MESVAHRPARRLGGAEEDGLRRLQQAFRGVQGRFHAEGDGGHRPGVAGGEADHDGALHGSQDVVEDLVGRFVDVEESPDQLVDAWRDLSAGLDRLDLVGVLKVRE